MSILKIKGGIPLSGEITVQGAKNSVLPIMAASILARGKVILHNCPDISDVDITIKILEHLGCTVLRKNNSILIDSTEIINYNIPNELMNKMRSSVMFLGGILAVCGKAELTTPGGCNLGARPIDMHISSLQQMGMDVSFDGEKIFCNCEQFHGANVQLKNPSVGATENIMIAAVTANGKTRIVGAAREPEICDLADFLVGLGAKIKGAGSSVIEIDGTPLKNMTEHTIIGDRICAATYLSAAAATGGAITMKGINPKHLKAVLKVFESCGCHIKTTRNSITLKQVKKPLKSSRTIKTEPYPGFPTDAGAILIGCMITADGLTILNENIFDSRFSYAEELQKMGVSLRLVDNVLIVCGENKLHGAELFAKDLRGGAGLVIAALTAEGESIVHGNEYINRGYENFCETFRLLGADIYETEEIECQEKEEQSNIEKRQEKND